MPARGWLASRTTDSSLGVLDEQDWWPPEYIAASRAFLVLLTVYLGFKAHSLPFSFNEGE